LYTNAANEFIIIRLCEFVFVCVYIYAAMPLCVIILKFCISLIPSKDVTFNQVHGTTTNKQNMNQDIQFPICVTLSHPIL